MSTLHIYRVAMIAATKLIVEPFSYDFLWQFDIGAHISQKGFLVIVQMYFCNVCQTRLREFLVTKKISLVRHCIVNI